MILNKQVYPAIVVLFLLILSSSVIPFVFGPSTASVANAQSNLVLKMTMVVPPNTLNECCIATGTSGYQLVALTSKAPVGAYLPNGTLDMSYGVCDWISHNANYTQWMFNVRPGEKWSDGTNVTANDLLTTYGPLYGFNPSVDYYGLYHEVVKEYALNTSTAVYDLNVSNPLFGDRFSYQTYKVVYPASAMGQPNGPNSSFFNVPTAGQFYTSGYTEGAFQMTLLRNNYYRPLAAMNEIDINFVDSLSLTATGLLSGKVDLAPIEPADVQAITSNPNLRVLDEKSIGISTLEYNSTLYPYNMTQFRQALAFGINESQYINQAFNGYAQPGYSGQGLVPPAVSNYYNPNQVQYRFDPNQSLSLLQQIGIKKGPDGFLHYPNGTIATLKLWASTDQTPDVVGAASVAQNLQQLGFQVNTQITSSANLISYYATNTNGITHDLLLFSTTVTLFDDPNFATQPAWNVYWLPVQTFPYWIYPPSVNQQYLNNYSVFSKTTDPTQVKQAFQNIQALSAQYLPTIVLAYPDQLFGYSVQRWTNWPSNGYLEFETLIWNWTAFASLQPTSGTITTSSTISSASSSSSNTGGTSTTNTASSTTSATTASSITTSSSTSSASSSSPDYLLYGVIVAIVIIIAGAATILIRRRR